MPVDYSQSKIYKLVSNFTDDIYIGSTTQKLSSRKAEHFRDFKTWRADKRKFITSFKLFELGEVEIVLLENFPCENKEELHARERYFIENNGCVNKYIPGRSKKEYYYDNKEAISIKYKAYQKDNKEKIKAYQKSYRELQKLKKEVLITNTT